MTEERDRDRWWSELPEDERQRYLKAFGAMLAIGASRFRAEQRRRQEEAEEEEEEAELSELRRISKAADPMLAGVPAKREGRAHPCC